MTRLTKTPADIANMYHVYNKLSKLEDIEEGFGVDLINLLTAGTIYTIFNNDRMFYHIDIENGGVCTSEVEFYPFSDYGRTWAFTRQELEKS